MPRKPLDNEWAAWYPFRKAGSACRCLLLSTPPEAHCQVDRGINRRRNFVKFNDTDDQLEKIIFAVVFWSCAFSCRKILEKFCLYLLTFVSRSFTVQVMVYIHRDLVLKGLRRVEQALHEVSLGVHDFRCVLMDSIEHLLDVF